MRRVVSKKKNTFASSDDTNLPPVLILPGFMSSGLEIKQSESKKNWEGKRIWLNLKELGFQAISKDHGKINYAVNESFLEQIQHRHSIRSHSMVGLVVEGTTQHHVQLQVKNAFIQHMCLDFDMCSEVNGTKVRAIEGLEGVDYLTPGAMTSHLSYVFGPVINALKDRAGYKAGLNLDAAPYDWRIPPSTLQQRDQYFIKTVRKIEKLFLDNNNTPVVLLCHSMGCKVGHYFLNWVHDQKKGQEWIDTFIHSFVPVGAPHLGAPKSLRALIDGDKMGLEAFLSDDESLAMARSLGSSVWLLPTQLPSTGAPSNAFVRRNALLKIDLMPIDFSSFFKNKSRTKLKIGIQYGKHLQMTDFKDPLPRSSGYDFSDRFVFRLPDTTDARDLKSFQIFLYDPGPATTRRISENGPYYSWGFCPIRFLINFLFCPIYFAYLPFKCLFVTGSKGVDATANAIGKAALLASSDKISLEHLFLHRSQHNQHHKEKIKVVTLSHVNNSKRCSFLRKPTFIQLTLRIRWQTWPYQKDVKVSCSPVAQFAERNHNPKSQYHNTASNFKPVSDEVMYEPVTGDDLLIEEDLFRIQHCIKHKYDNDRAGPRSRSSFDPPPVMKINAIYGVNLPTEVGAVYKRNHMVRILRKVQKAHSIDKKAKSDSPYYMIKNGIVFETTSTPQIKAKAKNHENDVDDEEDEIIFRSGDGTVPYWSLQHVRTWQDSCDVTIHEIEGAEHREILADRRFHDILINHLTNNEDDANDINNTNDDSKEVKDENLHDLEQQKQQQQLHKQRPQSHYSQSNKKEMNKKHRVKEEFVKKVENSQPEEDQFHDAAQDFIVAKSRSSSMHSQKEDFFDTNVTAEHIRNHYLSVNNKDVPSASDYDQFDDAFETSQEMEETFDQVHKHYNLSQAEEQV